MKTCPICGVRPAVEGSDNWLDVQEWCRPCNRSWGSSRDNIYNAAEWAARRAMAALRPEAKGKGRKG